MVHINQTIDATPYRHCHSTTLLLAFLNETPRRDLSTDMFRDAHCVPSSSIRLAISAHLLCNAAATSLKPTGKAPDSTSSRISFTVEPRGRRFGTNSHAPTSWGGSANSHSSIATRRDSATCESRTRFANSSNTHSLWVVMMTRTPACTASASRRTKATCIAGCKCDSGSSMISTSPGRTKCRKYSTTGASSDTIDDAFINGRSCLHPTGR